MLKWRYEIRNCGTKWWKVVTDMYMGEYSHTIDTKGRVIVPAKFRDKLEDAFVVTQGLDGCLYVYDHVEWEKFEEKLSQLPMNNPNTRKYVRFFLAGACEVEVDKQGRILIPQKLRTHAQLSKDVVFLGMGDRIEIWSKENWESCDYGNMDEVADNLSAMGINI